MKQITNHYDEGSIYLGLFFRPWLSEKQTLNIRSKYRIIQRFFDIHQPCSISVDDSQELLSEEEKEAEVTANNDSMPSISELYSMLREAHEKDKDDTVHQALLPSYFVPQLRSYQSKALHWMLNREKLTKYSLAEFVPIRCHFIPNKSFYFNYRTVELMDHDPGKMKIPPGGILAGKIFPFIFAALLDYNPAISFNAQMRWVLGRRLRCWL